jgi:hypothetical protein
MYKIAEKLEALTGAKKAKKKTRNWTDYVLPSLGAAGAGVGAAGLGAAYGIAGDAQADFIRKKLDSASNPMPQLPGDTALTHYTDVLSAAAGLTPFGLTAGEGMTQLRSVPEIMAKAKVDPDYILRTPMDVAEARAHYDDFRKGPAAAYEHMTHPGLRGMPANILPKFKDAWRKFVIEEIPGRSRFLDPHQITTSLIPHERQMQFLRNFHKNLPEPERSELAKYESPDSDLGKSLAHQTKNYAAPAKGVLDARDALKNIGITATGATAGGALGYYLHQALAGEKQKKGLTATKLLSALGGAGLGGLAAYYGGTGAGRQAALTKLLSAVPG